MPYKQKLRPEEKVKIVRKYLAGEVSIRGAAAEVGVDGRTIQQWAMQYESEGPGAFLPSRRNHTYSSALKVCPVLPVALITARWRASGGF